MPLRWRWSGSRKNQATNGYEFKSLIRVQFVSLRGFFLSKSISIALDDSNPHPPNSNTGIQSMTLRSLNNLNNNRPLRADRAWDGEVLA